MAQKTRVDVQADLARDLQAAAQVKARAAIDARALPSHKRIAYRHKAKLRADALVLRAKTRYKAALVKVAAWEARQKIRAAQLKKHDKRTQKAKKKKAPPRVAPPKIKGQRTSKKGKKTAPPGVVHKKRTIGGGSVYSPRDWSVTEHGIAPVVLRGITRSTPMASLLFAMIEPGLTTQADAQEFLDRRAELEAGRLTHVIEVGIDRDGLIIVTAGTHALLAARALGIEQLPVSWRRYPHSLRETDAVTEWQRLGTYPPLPQLLPSGIKLQPLVTHGESPSPVVPVGFFPEPDQHLLDIRRELTSVSTMIASSHPKVSCTVHVVANDDGTVDGQATIRIPFDGMGNPLYGIDDFISMIIDINTVLKVPKDVFVSVLLGFRTNLDTLEIIKRGYLFFRDTFGMAQTAIYWQDGSRQNENFMTAAEISQSISEDPEHEVPVYVAVRLYWSEDGQKPSRYR
jgi:hypothetical protein